MDIGDLIFGNNPDIVAESSEMGAVSPCIARQLCVIERLTVRPAHNTFLLSNHRILSRAIRPARFHAVVNDQNGSHQRFFSVSAVSLDEKHRESKDSLIDQSHNEKGVDTAEPVVHRVPDEHLPSHRESLRWNLSKRFHASMDELMKQLAITGQRINNYTGTDYSSIDALRQEIKEQEQLVKAKHLALSTAKNELDESHHQKGSSASELVGLLERKHSWSGGDLERYMSLVRSEHANDQAVQKAKDKVATAEKALEEARTRLEKRERAQYHEEQIWSDTIRRNSTWVTIGLMGVNIGLLLVNLVIFEPWRRTKLVREVRTALDEKTILPHSSLIEESAETVVAAAISEELLIPEAVSSEPEPTSTKETVLEDPESTNSIPTYRVPELYKLWSFQGLKTYIQHSLSDQPVLIRQVDLTTVAMQAVVLGASLSSIVLYLLRNK